MTRGNLYCVSGGARVAQR